MGEEEEEEIVGEEEDIVGEEEEDIVDVIMEVGIDLKIIK